MSIGRWTDKEVVVHIHNGVLLSYKKEHVWVSSNEVDEIGAYYTEWSKSERETQILYINAYIWSLERWKQWSYMQGSKAEQTFGLCGGRWGWDDLREQYWNMYITICKIDNQCKFNEWSREHKAGASGQPKGMGWRGRCVRVSGWGDTCTPVADTCQCMAKTTTVL